MSLRLKPTRRSQALALLVTALSCWFAGSAVAQGDSRLVDAAMKRDRDAVRTLLDQKADVDAVGADGSSALLWLVRVDDLELARRVVRAGASPTRPNSYGVTPLFLACSNGNAQMIRLLLDAGADPNGPDPTGETPLMTAARIGNPDAVKVLLDYGAIVDARDPEFQQTALMMAVRENHAPVVQILVEDWHADVNARTRIGKTPQWVLPNSVPGFGHGIGIVRGGLPDRGSRYLTPGGLTPLLYAARDGRLESAEILIKAGATLEQTDANGITPLLMAVANNHIDVARFLIDKGAQVNVSDWYGRTPLWTAVETRNMDLDNATFENGVDREPVLDLIKTLLARDADPNPRLRETPPIRRQMLRITGSLSWVDFTGQTPFLTASLAGDLTVMRLLLEYGADPYLPTFGGTTALMAAAGINWVVDQTYDEGPQALLEAVTLCWELGMDVNAVNSMGLTAVHGAANRGSDDIIRFLVEKGARLDLKDNEDRTPLTWAEGVFLATHPAKPKPSSIALIKTLMGRPPVAQR
jgi:ankyrin repeat protein